MWPIGWPRKGVVQYLSLDQERVVVWFYDGREEWWPSRRLSVGKWKKVEWEPWTPKRAGHRAVVQRVPPAGDAVGMGGV